MAGLLLLIDGRVKSHDIFVASVKDNVTPIVFDALTDTYATLMEKIRMAVNGKELPYSTVGIIQHGSASNPAYGLLTQESVALLNDGTEMKSWAGIMGFFTELKRVVGITTVDLITCAIYANPLWVTALNYLEAQTGMNFRASKDATGNLASGGNWTMESDNVNIEGLYFIETIYEYKDLLLHRAYYTSNKLMVSSAAPVPVEMISASNPVNGMTRIIGMGSITTWGSSSDGGNSSAVAASLTSDIVAVASNEKAFAAIKSNGSVVSWGAATHGGDSSSVAADLTSGVKAIASTSGVFGPTYGGAFAALKEDGSVITWGYGPWGGDLSTVSVNLSSGVIAIAATGYAFAALKANGSVVTWGDSYRGGDSSSVSSSLSSGVISIASTANSFAALKSDGSVITWGAFLSSSAAVSSGVINIAATEQAFAALKRDGSIVAWGSNTQYGSDNSHLWEDLSSGCTAIASTRSAFAALRNDGKVVTWGDSYAGGDSTSVSGSLSNGVTAIASAGYAFAALKNSGEVVAWGDSNYGGNTAEASSSVSSGIVSIASSETGFAALSTTGSVTVWGSSWSNSIQNVAGAVSSNVTAIIPMYSAFAAIKKDSSVVTWGVSNGVYNGTLTGVSAIVATASAFAAIRSSQTITVTSETPEFMGTTTLSVTSPEAGATYQWYKNITPINGATGSSYIISDAVDIQHNGIYFVRRQLNGSVADSNGIIITVSAPKPPVITSQAPVGEIIQTKSFMLSVSSSYNFATYQWIKDGTDINGETGSSLTVNAADATTNNGVYTVRQIIGSSSSVSNGVTISVIPLPVIAQQPTSVIAGQSFTLSVTSPHTGAIYNWYKNGVAIVGASGLSYTTNGGLTAGTDGEYTVRMTIGGASAESMPLTLVITAPSAPVITANTQTPVYLGGFTLSVTSPYANATFQWYNSGVVIDGATSTSYSVSEAKALSNDGSYMVRQTIGGYILDSNTISVTVGSPLAPVITGDNLQPAYQTSFTLSIPAPVAGATYTWYRNGVEIDGATTTSYFVEKATTLQNAGAYNVIMTLDGKNITSNTLDISIYYPPVVVSFTVYTDSIQNTIASPPYGIPPYHSEFSLYLYPVFDSASYTWFRDGVEIPGVTSDHYTVASASASEHDGNYTVIMHLDGQNFTDKGSKRIVVGSPTLPTIVTTTQSPSYASSFTLSVSNLDELGSYQWYKDDTILEGATDGSYTVDAAIPSQNSGTYKVKMLLDGKNLESDSISITVDTPPMPVISATSLTPNYGSPLVLSITDPLSGAAYQWYRDDAPIINASSTSYVIDNAIGSQHNGTYSVRMVTDGQQYTSNTLVIAVSVASEIISNPSIDSIRIGQNFTLSVSSVQPSATYQWYKDTVAIDGATSTSYTVVSATASDHNGAYYIKTNLDGFSADSNILNISVIVPPFITQQPTDDPIFVADETLSYKIATMFTNGMAIISTITMTVVSPNATSYQWYRSGLPISGATSPSYTVSSGAIGVYSYYVSVSNAAGTIPSRTAMINITRPLALGEISNKIRTLPVVSFIQQDISSTLILDYSQQNPEFDLSYIRVTLTQNTGTTYTNSSGQLISLNETYVKVFWPADVLFSPGDDVTAPRLYGMLQLDTFYHNCSYNVAVDVYFNDGQGTGWSGSVINTDTQYVDAEQNVKPAVVVYDSSTHNVPELRVNIKQLIVQQVRGSWDDGNVVHMRVIVDDPNSAEQAKTFEVPRPFYYENGDNDTRTVNGYPLVLGTPDIAFGNTYHISASVIYRDGTSTGGDNYVVSNFNNPPDLLIEDQVKIDLYQYLISNEYTATALSNGYPYHNASLEYIRSESQIENRLSAANNLLISWGAITEPTSHATVIEKILEVIDTDTIESTRSFNVNGAGYLYIAILWMLLDTNEAAASLLYIKKYVVGMLMLIEFNMSNNTEILTEQFKDDSTKKFHKIIRLNRYWNTPDFPDQLSRIDAGAFNTSCKIVMRELPSSYTAFDVDGLGNIVLDPVHFPHILNKKADPYNLDTYYSDKLFLIGHALMPGAPNYMSFNKKIVDMCDNHVFNLSGDAIYDLASVLQFQFQEILSNVIINRNDYTYDWKSGIMYNAANVATYKAVHTFYTPIAVGGFVNVQQYVPATVFDTKLNTWNYTGASSADYDNWYVSYIPPNYFRNSDITEAIVSWKNTASSGFSGVSYYLSPLRDTIYIGANAFPPTCTLSLPAPYLDNALLKFKDVSLPGGSVLDIINAYVPPSSLITVSESGGLITLQSTVNTLPMNYFTRTNLTYININIDHPLLRIPPGSLPVGCNVMRNGISGTLLPGSYGQPYSQGKGPSVYTQELANMSTDLVVFSGIVYKNYDVDGSCEILWIIDFSGKDITFPPVPLTVYNYWSVGCKDIYIPNIPFKCGASMFLLLAGKVYYSGISYKLFNPSGATLTYDRVPIMTDADKLTGTVRILDTGASGNYYIQNLPDVFKTYTDISLLVLPPTMNIDINSMVDGQVFECDGITWNHNKTLGYPVLVTLPVTKQQALCLPYVKFYDSIFENAINIISVSNAAGYTIGKAVGKKAFKNCSSLVNFNYFVEDIDDEAFYGTTSLKSLVFGATLSRIGSRAFYGSGIESITIDDASNITLTDSSFEGASYLQTLTIKNISSTFSTAVFAGLTSLKTLRLEFLDSAMATIDTLNAPNIEAVIITGGVVAVGQSVFQNCSKLKSVTINGHLSALSDSMFADSQNSLEYLYVNLSGDSVINCQFNHFTKLKEVQFMGSGTAILHASPFTGCSSLRTYVNTLLIDSNMSDDAFGGCAALKEISLTFKDNSIKKIVSSAFAGLTVLERFAITGSCSLISSTILPNSTQLKYIEINGELSGSITASGMTSVETFIVNYSSDIYTEIVDFAFKNNSVLKTVAILGGLKRIGTGAFYNCSALTSVILSDGLTDIGDFAFAKSGISGEVIIPSTVDTLGEGYFISCPNLRKLTYNCPVLFFKNPTSITEDLWNIMNKPTMTSYDIIGDVNVLIGDTSDNFVYKYGNSRIGIFNGSFFKNINVDQFNTRKTKIAVLVGYLKLQYEQLATTTTHVSTDSTLAGALYYMIIKLTNLGNDYTMGRGMMPDIKNSIQEYLDTVNSINTTIYRSITDVYLPPIIDANAALYSSGANMKSIRTKQSLNHSPITLELETDKIDRIIGETTILKENNMTYAQMEATNLSIILSDNTIIDISGRTRINLNNFLGDENYCNILFDIDTDIESINSAKEIDFTFNGAEVSISSLSDIINSQIGISSEHFVAYDFAMRNLNDCILDVTAWTVTLYDNAFNQWKYSTLKINTINATCGKNVFFGSSNINIISNVELSNRTDTRILNIGDKTLYDISSILTSINISDHRNTRGFKIETYLPANTTDVASSLLVLRFQHIATLKEYAIIVAPDDWFWCYRTSKDGSDFQSNSDGYNYVPADAARDSNGNIVVQAGKTDPPEYCGLYHCFAPDTLTYNGLIFKRTSGLDSGWNVSVRALFATTSEAAEVRRLSVFQSVFFDWVLPALELITAFIPVVGPVISTGLTIFSTAYDIAQLTMVMVDSFSPTTTFDYEDRSYITRGAGGFIIKVGLNRIKGALVRVAKIFRKSDNVLTSVVVRGPGGSGSTHTIGRAVFKGFKVSIESGANITQEQEAYLASIVEHAVEAASNGGKTVTKVVHNPAKLINPNTTTNEIITTIKMASKENMRVATIVESGLKKGNEQITSVFNVVKKRGTKTANTLEVLEDSDQLRYQFANYIPRSKLQNLKKVTRESFPDNAPELASVGTSRTRGSLSAFARLTTTQKALVTVGVARLLTSVALTFANCSYHPRSHRNISPFMREVLSNLRSESDNAVRATLTPHILKALHSILNDDTTSAAYAVTLLNLLKEEGPEYDVTDIKLRELATYNAYTSQYLLRVQKTTDLNTRIHDTIDTAISSAANVRTPPYMFPLTGPEKYNKNAREDFIHHYTLQRTNAHFTPLETDDMNHQLGASQMANALMVRREYMFLNTFAGEATSSDSPITNSSNGNTILAINENLDEVYLGNRVVPYEISGDEVPNNVFCGAFNITISIPEGITTLSDYAYCSTDGTDGNIPFTIQSLILPSTIQSIGKRAFYRSKVKNVFFPENVNFIGNSAFENCGLVNAIALKETASRIAPRSVTVSLKPTTEIITYDNNVIFRGFDNANVIDGSGATVIYSGVDSNGNPAAISIFGVDKINITNISGATRLKHIQYNVGDYNVDTSITTYSENNIQSFKFSYKQSTITTVNSISSILFSGIEPPTVNDRIWVDGIINFNYYTFGEGDKYNLTLTSTSKFIFTTPANVIYSTGVSKLTRSRGRSLRDTGTIIEDNAFSGNTDLTTFIAPENTTSLGTNAFSNCTNLTWVDLPDTLTSIGEEAFSGCSNLTDITLPASLINIGSNIFTGATSLKTINFQGGLPPAVDINFINSMPPSITKLKVPTSDISTINRLLQQSGNTNIIIQGITSNTNSFPIRINPYRAIDQIIVYNKNTIEALSRGDILPTIKEVVWSPAPAGAVMRGTGRFISVIGANRLLRYKFTEVQLINGGRLSEGVTGSVENGWYNGWICIWAADGIVPVL